jgi:hypothetical protein
MHRFAHAATRWLGHEIWNIGIVEQSASDIVARGITSPVHWLPPGSPWTFIADPFAVPTSDGQWLLFAEHMDYWKTKGSVWSGMPRSVAATPWVDLQPALDAVPHMSFPFAFSHAGIHYLLCETWEAGGASLYAVRDGRWRFEASINPMGRNPIDAVLFLHEDRWWLFCSHPGRGPNAELYLYHAGALGEVWQAHLANPVVRDVSRARMAGPIFSTESGLIRPGQDCSVTYGGALTLNRIVALDAGHYIEEPVRHIPPIPPYRHGLHTICPMGDRTVIDGKVWRVHALDPLRKVYSWHAKSRRRAALRSAAGSL